MPTTRKRRSRNQRRSLVSDEAVQAFVADNWVGLHRALRLKPWEASPLDVDEADTHIARPTTGYAGSINQAIELRKSLLEAGQGERHDD